MMDPLLQTVGLLSETLAPMLDRMEWLNLGGGYLFGSESDREVLQQIEHLLREHDIKHLFIEPGAAISRNAGYLVTSVVDLFDSDSLPIAVLDTSINHLPEVFEYQWQPPLAQSTENGAYRYRLAGATCLAGDLFGGYEFDKPLSVGSRIVFTDVGAYSMVKANMFNGISLPNFYLLHENGRLELIKHFHFEEFLTLCGAEHAQGL